MNPVPDRFFQLSLIFLVALNLVPHFSDYTVPTLAVGGLCLVWRLLYEFQVTPLPNSITKVGLVVALTYLVYQNYGQILGLESGSALLICAVSLKLVDRVGYRDAMVLLFLNFMLLLARFFESQTLGITIFAAFVLIITTALLVQLHNGSQVKFNIKTLLKTGTKLFLQIAPFMILLFFVFPRFSTGFLGADAKRPSLNGFSDSMEPGALASLAQSDQVAFRVVFKKRIPTSPEMYWRGGILTVNREMKWEKGNIERGALPAPEGNINQSVEQEIMIEPVFNEWIFSMDKPIWIEHSNENLQRMTRFLEGSIYRLTKPYDKKFVYSVFSVPEVKTTLDEQQRQDYLQSPPIDDPRVLALVKNISAGARSDEQKAHRLMLHYQKEFKYSLSPGAMKSAELGEFLFEKKIGFCEHFAVSFAAIMRLAGVPARIVVGFQGGKRNTLSDYYLVTSKDAHAWTEIWSSEKSTWVRFDPTTMVAPLRIELGGELYHSMTEQELLAAGGEGFLDRYREGWMKQAYLAVDALATNWNMFLLGYDRSGQRDFFARMGFKNINQSLLIGVSLSILLCFFLWVRLRHGAKRRPDKASQVAYLLFREKLKKKGFEKEANEGPNDFLVRIKQQFPDQKAPIENFRRVYLENYYGDIEHPVNYKQMVQNIKI